MISYYDKITHANLFDRILRVRWSPQHSFDFIIPTCICWLLMQNRKTQMDSFCRWIVRFDWMKWICMTLEMVNGKNLQITLISSESTECEKSPTNRRSFMHSIALVMFKFTQIIYICILFSFIHFQFDHRLIFSSHNSWDECTSSI